MLLPFKNIKMFRGTRTHARMANTSQGDLPMPPTQSGVSPWGPERGFNICNKKSVATTYPGTLSKLFRGPCPPTSRACPRPTARSRSSRSPGRTAPARASIGRLRRKYQDGGTSQGKREDQKINEKEEGIVRVITGPRSWPRLKAGAHGV